MAVGCAIGGRRLHRGFGSELWNGRTLVVCGDGCLMEGGGQEATSLAGHLDLGHLNRLHDMNGISIGAGTDLSFTQDTAARLKALGWHVLEACGHTPPEIDDALASAKLEKLRPSVILFLTTIGQGAPNKAGKLPPDLATSIETAKMNWSRDLQGPATRKASQMCLEVLTQLPPEVIGGSADLTVPI